MIIVLGFFTVLVSLSFHECAHGLSALWMGDSTARDQGRLSLNPLKHIDPFGTVALPLILLALSFLTGGRFPVFGYARPVPVNPLRFRNRRAGMALVSVSGPLANLALAFAFAVLLVTVPFEALRKPLVLAVQINLILAVFNLLPVPPLDGSRIVSAILPKKAARRFERTGLLGWVLLLFLLQTDFLSWLLFHSARALERVLLFLFS
jgi:Zn-dependent protease